MTNMLWGVYPYVVFTLFFAVPVIRMVFRPYSITTRASGLFGHRLQGIAMLLFHWGIFAVFIGHILGFIGGALMIFELVDPWFRYLALVGGLMTLAGSCIALLRRFVIPEVRAMSAELDDYLVHFFLIAILGIALFQIIFQGMFGAVYNAAPWFASIWAFAPDPELMLGVTLLSKIHIFLALTFFGYFPFTKMAHFWALPVNYFVRTYQVMRTNKVHSQDKWELGGRTDKSYMTYMGLIFIVGAIALSTYMVFGQS